MLHAQTNQTTADERKRQPPRSAAERELSPPVQTQADYLSSADGQAGLPSSAASMRGGARLSVLQRTHGNRGVLNMLKKQSARAQGKGAAHPVQAGRLQRQCAACGEAKSGTEACAECSKQGTSIQRSSASGAEMGDVSPVVYEAINSPGQPLDSATRVLMESRFAQQSKGRESFLPAPAEVAHNSLTISKPGDPYEQEADRVAETVMRSRPQSREENRSPAPYDFSSVRVHTDAKAAQSAQAVNALAYTVKQDIVFSQGEYEPHTERGQRLLAHELVHTIQQAGNSDNSPVQRQEAQPEAEASQETATSTEDVSGAVPASTSSDSCRASLSLPISGASLASLGFGDNPTKSFRGAGGRTITISASANYDTPPGRQFEGHEDYSVRLRQCHTMFDEDVGDREVATIGSGLSFTRTLPGTGTFTDDVFYLMIKNGSHAFTITATFSVT